MAKKEPKYESDAVAAMQQFAHAMRWADGNDARLQQLRAAIQAVVDSPSVAVGVEPSGFDFSTPAPATFVNYGEVELPDWYRQPDIQLEQREAWLRSLGFGQGDIPTSGPVNITPTKRALPLLKVVVPGTRRIPSLRRTIDVHVDAIGQQLTAAGRKVFLWDGFEAFQKDPRLTAGLAEPEPGISWVLFDPFAHWDPQNGHKVASLNPMEHGWSLASVENLSALMAWPAYGPAMNGTKVPHINLAGLRTASGLVPCVYWWAGYDELGFGVRSVGDRDYSSASPRVREC